MVYSYIRKTKGVVVFFSVLLLGGLEDGQRRTDSIPPILFLPERKSVRNIIPIMSSVSNSSGNRSEEAVGNCGGQPVGPPIPDGFICPITHHIYEDPVMCADGSTYERAAIETWLQQPRGTDAATGLPLPPRSPLTNLPLGHVVLQPVRALRSAIESWLQHYPERRTKPPHMDLQDVRAAVDMLRAEDEVFVINGDRRELQVFHTWEDCRKGIRD